ncbi:uncharacterized protein LOC119391092 [Rhipicephalus sanguineus]|uniref:uncharacterized protein LOC119391092 n=1 Tax=Rhipicephalus sanguineus TaxID=34632 RepID=UPI0020C4E9D9|nr:uncharacterized protein LOC119391092 [Rhipicephalus sanguineus]
MSRLLIRPLYTTVVSVGYILILLAACRCEDEWTYGEGVAQWPNLDLDVENQCGGYYQSPINIVTRRTIYDTYLDINYYGYLDPSRNVSIVHDGNTVKVSSSKGNDVVNAGVDLNGWYKFEQLHFHWGSNSSLGSEHRIDGYTFPLEMHLVHMNTKYSTGEEALKHRDGLAVVAVFFQVSPRDNPALSAIVEALRQMSNGSTTRVNLASIPPLRQLMPRDLQLYYRYQGSLTTPPCSEVVTWTVLAQPSAISEAQLQAFRNLVVDHATWLWPEYQCIANNSCGGKQQSPVNIETFGVLHDIALKALEFEGHDVPFENFTVTNDGLSLILKASPLDTTSRTVQGGRLPGTFVFQHALFHWGSGSGQGSEHHIDGVAYPMEVQMVYTNEKYSAEVAATEKDGVAIIATLYRATFVDFDSVKAMRAVVAAVNSSAPRKRHRRRLLPWMARRLRVGRHGASGESDDNPPRLTLDSLLPSVGRSEYFTYRGSLTTPPCTESVRWTVFNRQAFISETVLQKFRSLKDYTGAKPLVDNFRPPQKLNGRKIISSFAPF